MAASDDQGTWLWQPPVNFSNKAHVKTREEYDAMYKRSIEDPDGFWGDIAENFHWHKKWEGPVSRSNFDLNAGSIFSEWFAGAETNLCYNALDRHVLAGRGAEPCVYWEGNDVNQSRVYTWQQYLDMVCRIANWLKSVGVGKGDDVTIYLPMVAELPACLLACARIGAVHSVVFAGFSADALADRMKDSNPKALLTASATMRGQKPIGLKEIVDGAIAILEKDDAPVPKVAVYHHEVAGPRETCPFTPGRDVWWQDDIDSQGAECPVEWMAAEAPLFKLYTSGSTGKPKGVLHTTAGYMVGAATTFKYIFDYRPGDIWWCTADCGWITGHSYLTYGPMVNGAAQVVFEGVPTYPDAGRLWQIVDKVGVTLFYTAPTAIRSLMKLGDKWVQQYSRSSLRLLGTVGEPINPEAWRWYHEIVGNNACPIVDTWWQTETGSIMITPLPGAWATKPGSAMLPFFGVKPVVVDEKGNELEGACEGALCIKQSWPSSMRTIAGDHPRYEATYFQAYKGYYFSGDGCKRDREGHFWITGRMDDVINVSGHRIGTAEVESALVLNPKCAEAAVVGVEHPVKGQAIYAFVTLMDGVEPSEDVRKELKMAVRTHIGAFTQPDVIHWAPGLPKTRSGKIMRRILRKIASKEDDQLGDTSTLADPSVVQQLISLRGQ